MADNNVRGITYSVTQGLVTERCCSCGVVFAMAKEFHTECRNDPGVSTGKAFFCPAGHRQWYTGETEATKLRRERDSLKQSIAYEQDRARRYQDDAEHQRARANGYKGHAAKITKRAKAGVCPCCNRHFTALERHMATKHPDFTADAPEPLRVVQGGKP